MRKPTYIGISIHSLAPLLHAVPLPVVQNDPTPAAGVKKLARVARQFFNTGGGRRVILDHRQRHVVEQRRQAMYRYTYVCGFPHSASLLCASSLPLTIVIFLLHYKT